MNTQAHICKEQQKKVDTVSAVHVIPICQAKCQVISGHILIARQPSHLHNVPAHFSTIVIQLLTLA